MDKGANQPGYPPQGPPPAYGMSPPPVMAQPPPPGTVVIVGGATGLGPNPSNIQCPSCHHSVQTRVEHENATKTHLFALLLCLIGCCPCALIPYCTDSCKNINHYCPSCGAFLGTHQN